MFFKIAKEKKKKKGISGTGAVMGGLAAGTLLAAAAAHHKPTRVGKIQFHFTPRSTSTGTRSTFRSTSSSTHRNPFSSSSSARPGPSSESRHWWGSASGPHSAGSSSHGATGSSGAGTGSHRPHGSTSSSPPPGGSRPPPGPGAGHRAPPPPPPKPSFKVPDWGKNAKSQRSLRRAYLSEARKHHPDVGGSTAKMQDLNNEWESVQKSEHFKGLPKTSHVLPSFFDELNSIYKNFR